MTKTYLLAKFFMYGGVKTYAQLNWVVRDYVSGTRAFHSTPATAKGDVSIQETNFSKHVKLIVRPDARVVNMETKIDILPDQLANVTLIHKMSDSNRTAGRAGIGSGGNTGYA